jgi:hypothetical protein
MADEFDVNNLPDPAAWAPQKKFLGFGIGAEKPPDINELPDPAAWEIKEPSLIKETGKAIVRGVGGIGEMTGHLLKAVGAKDTGETVDTAATKFQEQFAMNPEFQKSFVKRGILGGVESMPSSVAAGAPGAIAGTVIGGPIGGVIGYGLSAGTVMGVAEYQNYLDEYQKEFGKEAGSDIKALAALSGLAEGGFEALSDWIGGRLLFGSAVRPLAVTIKDILRTPLKKAVANYGKILAAETSTESATAAVEAYARQKGNVPTPGMGESAAEAIIPAAVMSSLFMGGGVGLKKLRTNRIETALQNTEIDPQERIRAATDVRTIIEESYVNPETGKLNDLGVQTVEAWDNYVQVSIANKQPINLDLMLDPLSLRVESGLNEIPEIKAQLEPNNPIVAKTEKPVPGQPEAVAPAEEAVAPVTAETIAPPVTVTPPATATIPTVFTTMPLDTLTKMAETGVKGAQAELAARQKVETAAPVVALAPEKVTEQPEKKLAEAGFRDFVKQKGINWEDLSKDNDLLLKLRGEYISGNKQAITPPTVIPAKEEVQTEVPIETPTPVAVIKKPRNTAEVRTKIATDKAAKESIAIAKRKVDTINLRENLSITTDPESMDYIFSDYISRLHSGTPGGLQGYTKGGEQVFAGSGYPEWVGDLVKKYGSKKTAPVLTKTGKAPGIDADAIIATIKRGMAGEKLTPYQRSVWEDINRIADQEARGDYSAVLDEFAKVRKGEDYAAAREQFAAEQIDIGASTESRADIEASYRESIKSEGYTPEEEAAALEEVNNFFKEASKPKETPKR